MPAKWPDVPRLPRPEMPLLRELACEVAGMRTARKNEMMAMCEVRFILCVVFIVIVWLLGQDFKSYCYDADSREREQAEGEERGDDED